MMGADCYRHPGKLLPDQLVQIHLEDILIDDFDVVKFRERFIQDGQQAAVDLDADHLVRPTGKLCGQHADTGSNFNHSPARLRISRFCHARTDGGID